MKTVDILQELFPTFVLGLEDVEVEALADVMEPRTLAAGTEVVAWDAPSGDFLVVVEGTLRVSVPTGLVLGEKGRGEWAADLGLIEPGPSPVGIETVGTVDLLAFPQAALRRLRSQPRVIGRLWRALARDLTSRLRACAAISAHDHASWGEALVKALATLYGIPPVPELGSWMPSSSMPTARRNVPKKAGRERLTRMLGAVEVFEPLDDQLLALLVRTAAYDAYDAGETIVREGESRDGLFFVIDGGVKVTLPSHLVECDIEGRIQPGEIFGQLSFVDGGPRSATCTAAEPTTVAVWFATMIEELLRLGADGRFATVQFLQWVTRQIGRDARRVSALLHAEYTKAR